MIIAWIKKRGVVQGAGYMDIKAVSHVLKKGIKKSLLSIKNGGVKNVVKRNGKSGN